MTNLDDILQELKRGLEDIYGPRLIALYLSGSQARGDAEEDSDIDVAMVLDDYARAGEEITRTIDVVAALSLEHDCVIQLMPVRAMEWRASREPLIRNVHREGRAVA
jgi:predicted nucleotidyltransferase